MTSIRIVFAVLATLWWVVGATSDATPVLPYGAWLIVCTLPAGAAARVAIRVSRTTLLHYLIAVTIAAVMRAAAFTLDPDSSLAPAAVWALMVATTGLLDREIREAHP